MARKAKKTVLSGQPEGEAQEEKKGLFEKVYEETYGRIPAPPSPLETAENFARTFVSPQMGGQSLLYATATLLAMFLIAYTEQYMYSIFGGVAVVTFPAYLGMWTVTYLASFTTIAGIFALIGNIIWLRASLRSISLSATAMAYYALATAMYMATSKLWVGLMAGYIAGLFVPAVVTVMNIAGPMLVYLLMGSSLFLVLLAIIFGFFFVVMAIGILVFMAFSLVSTYWSRYASTITPLWRVFAVWLILAVKQLLPPQVTYLFVAGYAIYAGIQASLSVGELYKSYQYLNALPAVILVALTPIGTVNTAMDTITGIVDQAFEALAPMMGEYSSILAGQYVAKWILSHIPPY
jgi:hypothetical protein